MAYGNLGNAFAGLGQYSKAVEFSTKALNISRELGDRAWEGRANRNLEAVRNASVRQGAVRNPAIKKG